MDRKFCTVRQFGESRAIGKTKIYAEIAAGRLRVVKIGRATRVPIEAAEEWDRLVLSGEVGPNRAKAA